MITLSNYSKKQIFKVFSILYVVSIFQITKYILQKQANIYGNNYILWFSICLIFIIILAEILLNYNTSIILTEIIVTSFLLHALFIPVTGLLGSDAQYDFHLIKLINNYGWSLQLDSPLAAWPAHHIFINIYSEIVGISLLDAARFAPSTISVIVLLFIFGLTRQIYKQDCVALICVSLFSTLYYFIFFHSLPIRETFAFVILFITLYLYIIGKKRNSSTMVFLAIVNIFVLIISHHFTVFMYLLFLIVFMIVNQIPKNNLTIFSEMTSKYDISNYVLLMIIAALTYWMFVSFYVFEKVIISFQNVLAFGDETITPLFTAMLIYPPLINIRTQMYSYSRAITFLMVILILFSIIYSIVSNKKRVNIYESSILVYIGIIFAIWLATTYGLVEASIYPERFELFAWAFLLIILSPVLHKFLMGRKLYGKIIAIVFIISFVAMNFSHIPPYFYDISKQPPYENGRARITYLPQEYLATDWFKGDGLIQGDRTTEDLLIHRFNIEIKTDPELFTGNLSRIDGIDWLIIRKEMFKRILGTREDNELIKKPLNLSIANYELINRKESIMKIYSNDEVEIYSIDDEYD